MLCGSVYSETCLWRRFKAPTPTPESQGWAWCSVNRVWVNSTLSGLWWALRHRGSSDLVIRCSDAQGWSILTNRSETSEQGCRSPELQKTLWSILNSWPSFRNLFFSRRLPIINSILDGVSTLLTSTLSTVLQNFVSPQLLAPGTRPGMGSRIICRCGWGLWTVFFFWEGQTFIWEVYRLLLLLLSSWAAEGEITGPALSCLPHTHSTSSFKLRFSCNQ